MSTMPKITPTMILALVAAVLIVLYLFNVSHSSHFDVLGQDFDTVAPSRFVVTAVPLAINAAVRSPTAVVTDVEEQPFQVEQETVPPMTTVLPVLTSIGTDIPVMPTLVPTVMSTTTPFGSSDTVTVWP